ncbi:hypothetical protein VNO78_15812 [Psophocarpus tetragonolobus]|uniref:Uncharacterized protein n=1 Tax=Psophocarpus tetragonolobus TaxID=3891 RepID=A0AAN9XK83_PSOTE
MRSTDSTCLYSTAITRAIRFFLSSFFLSLYLSIRDEAATNQEDHSRPHITKTQFTLFLEQEHTPPTELLCVSIPRNAVSLHKEREREVSVTVAGGSIADTIPKAASSHKFPVNA